MEYIVKLNLPRPPDEIISHARDTILNHSKQLDQGLVLTQGQDPAETVTVGGEVRHYGEHYVTPLSQQYQGWFKQHIPELPLDVLLKVSVTTKGSLWPHQDYKRNWALNYVIDLGGDAVETYWAQQQGLPLRPDFRPLRYWRLRPDLDILHREQLPSHTWMILATDIVHGNRGQTGDRITITTAIDDDTRLKLLRK